MVEKSIYDVVKAASLRNPKGFAYDFLGMKRTYEDFMDDIEACAYFLKKEGITKGDIISIYLPNCPMALVFYYAINKIGAISNFIHPKTHVEKNSDIFIKMQPKLIIVLSYMKSKINVINQLPINSKILCVDLSKDLLLKYKMPMFFKELITKTKHKNVIHYNKIKNYETVEQAQIHVGDVATILLTGGTTGKAKGVCLSSENMNNSAIQTSHYRADRGKGDKMLAILPVFHGYGLVNCIHTTISESQEVILLPYYKRKTFRKTIIRCRPNYILGIPVLYQQMINIFEKHDVDFSYLKGLYCGSEKLSDEVLNKFNKMIKSKGSNVPLQEGYGLTECVGACIVMPKDQFKSGSVGKPYVGVQVKIIMAKDGSAGKPYETGEICIKSKTVMIGYYKNKTNSIEELLGERWLHTGDYGYVDEEGYVYFVGRMSRKMKISGHEIFPNKIEELVMSIDGVKNACLVEVSDNEISSMHLYIEKVKKTNKKSIELKILDSCNKNLPSWYKPRKIIIIDKIPKTPLNKNDYKALQELISDN